MTKRPLVGPEWLPVCVYCGGDLLATTGNAWRVSGDGGRPCPESVRAGYPAHCPTPKQRDVTTGTLRSDNTRDRLAP